MKDLITAAASLLLLLVFVIQFSAGHVMNSRLFQADGAVETFRERAGVEGCIGTENAGHLKEELSRVLDCSPEEIQVSGEDLPVPEGTLVYYRIGYPLQNIVAAGKFLGIQEEENRVWHEEEGWVVSRLEKHDYNGGDSPGDDGGDGL